MTTDRGALLRSGVLFTSLAWLAVLVVAVPIAAFESGWPAVWQVIAGDCLAAYLALARVAWRMA